MLRRLRTEGRVLLVPTAGLASVGEGRAAVICGAWMPKARERCAREAGHRDCHRTRWALDNALYMARGRGRMNGATGREASAATLRPASLR